MSAEQHRRMATRKRLWHSYLPLVMWDIGTRINLKKMSEWYDWFSCRSNTNACEKCPVSTTDLRIFTMASWSACPLVPKQISGLGRNQGETYTLISFLLPYTLKGWIFMNQKEPGEVQIFYRFTVRILLHISRWWSTIAQNLWLPANAETRANNCWNLWLWTIIIWSSVTRWRPMKAANSRGVSGACSICSHQIQSAHAGVRLWWSFDEHWSWFKANDELMISRLEDDERAELGLLTSVAGPAPLHAAGSMHRRARGSRRGGEGCTCRCLARAHTFTHFAGRGRTCRWRA